MRNSQSGDARTGEPTKVASQATLYKELAADSVFPTTYMRNIATGPTLGLLEALEAIHEQLVVNASLLREVVYLLRESGTTSSFGLVRTDRNDGTQDEGRRRSPGVLGSDLVSGTEETSG